MRHVLTVLLLMTIAFPAMAGGNTQHQPPEQTGDSIAMTMLEQVDPSHVCMVTNRNFSSPQIAVDIEGKTYYGCCNMCKGRLENHAEIRMGTDPVSGNPVDKAEAIIGAAPDGSVHYFETRENLKKFSASRTAE